MTLQEVESELRQLQERLIAVEPKSLWGGQVLHYDMRRSEPLPLILPLRSVSAF